MKTVCLIFTVLFSLLLQTKVSFFGVAPMLTIIIVYYGAMRSGTLKGVLLGSLIGIVEDSITGGILGPNLLGKGVAGYLSSLISGGIFRWTPLLGMLAVFTVTLTDGLLVFLSKALYENLPAPPLRAVLSITLQAVMNMTAGIFIKPRNAE
ncbi:MAG TPA: rod shape-determining protein MreD [Thermodesulfovibrionales bacterium]|jgi:rod shape-determining protein MreD|nr:rod shape-determining protein MreD [Thermodesulfovibrionales bacterium]